MKAFNYEIYTNNPATGENGWDIKFRTVFAETRTEIIKALVYLLGSFILCVLLFAGEAIVNYLF